MKSWKKVKEKTVYNNYRTVIERTFLAPNKKKITFEVVEGGLIVCVLALTPQNKVVLAREFRPGTEEVYDELPGGFVDKDEDPHKAVKRELLEETGYSGDFKFLSLMDNEGISISDSFRATSSLALTAEALRRELILSRSKIFSSDFVTSLNIYLF